MDYHLLEYFLRVAERGSINRSAQELHLSQSALSRHMATLEHSLGASLFHRTRGGVTLTEAGELLAQRAGPILRQLTLLKEQVGDKAAGQLAVGLPASWHHIFTADFITQGINDMPGVKLRIFEGASNALSDHMSAGLVDLAVLPFKSASMSSYAQTKLLREPTVLVGPESACLKPDEILDTSRLAGLPLVLVNRPNGLRMQVENALARSESRFNLIAEADTVAIGLVMARRAGAYIVLPACALFDQEVCKGLSWSPLKGIYLTWSLYVNEARTHSLAVREGRRLIVELVSQHFRQRHLLPDDVQMFV
ncbi:LysR family transcriptional regulator [Pusillimonas sp. CC-YST705]|uniref:LysR family transcriptional regulator n=1 Tax=Mesopusillimonas faecipullorum TaxID=2755040 RepID=A0ABS8CCN1_9BURK|nr:LysR family transcriptional regulator [Mesopusillimonas faecipullorum]MCB5363788.1 LysR family transcriptional regulator [Mesopusillimonas faecipullorum]